MTSLKAAIESTATLGPKFEALLQFVSQNIKAQPAWPGAVLESLLKTVIDWESPGILKELLELEHSSNCTPRPNSGVLTKACEKDDFDLVKLLVEMGYRLRTHKLDKSRRMKKKRTIAQLILQRVDYHEEETFEADTQIQNLKIMGLATKRSYILACYMSLAEKYNRESATVCECSGA